MWCYTVAVAVNEIESDSQQLMAWKPKKKNEKKNNQGSNCKWSRVESLKIWMFIQTLWIKNA